jgi:hypothetical protein
MNKRYIVKGIFLATLLSSVSAKTYAQSRNEKVADSAAILGRQLEQEPGRFFPVSKINSTAAVSSVSGETAYQTTTPNITNTLYGRLSGLTVSSSS